MYASRGLKITSRLLQVGLPEPIWTQLGTKLAPSWLKLDPYWAQVGSKLTQVGVTLAPSWLPLKTIRKVTWLTSANLGPSWLQVDSSWAHVGSKSAPLGPMLAQSWLQLGSSWTHVDPICRSPVTPGPTETLPDPFPAASWLPKPLQNPKWTPKGPPKLPTWTLKAIKCL